MFKLSTIRKNIGKIVLYSASASIVAFSLLFAFTIFQPIDVVKDWTLTTEKTDYTVGEYMNLTSTLTKLMSVDGESSTYLVCNNNGAEQRYFIRSTEANRSLGYRKTAIVLPLPSVISGLPKTCHINISARYSVYGYRQVLETVDSNTFTLRAVSVSMNSPVSEAPRSIEQVGSITAPYTPEHVEAPTQPTSTQMQSSTQTSTQSDVQPVPETDTTVRLLGIPVCVPLTSICVSQ